MRTFSFGGVPAHDRALERMRAFVPYAGCTYAAKRNFDFGAGQHRFVSCLSPYLRHRMITEEGVVAATLRAHTGVAAEEFMQEVCLVPSLKTSPI